MSAIPSGFRFMEFLQTSNGIITGGLTPHVAGQRQMATGYHLQGARTVDPSVPDPVVIPIEGDDGTMATEVFDAAELPGGVLENAVTDLLFDGFLQNTKVQDLTAGGSGGVVMGSLAPKTALRTGVCAVFQQQAKSTSNNKRGAREWYILIAPSCTIKPLGSSKTMKAFNPNRFRLDTSVVSKTPWGTPFTIADNNFTQTPLIPMVSERPIRLFAFVGNGTQTEFDLPYTLIDGYDYALHESGIRQVITTDFTITTNNDISTVAFTSAPAEGALCGGWMQVANLVA